MAAVAAADVEAVVVDRDVNKLAFNGKCANIYMSPLFAYVMVLSVYIAVAVIIWVLCAVLSLFPGSKQFSFETALGLLCSFPSVFFIQIVMMPLLFLFFLLISLPVRFFLTGTIRDVTLIAFAVVFLLGGFALASLYGFIEGWLIGIRLARRTSLSLALKHSTAYYFISSILRCVQKMMQP